MRKGILLINEIRDLQFGIFTMMCIFANRIVLTCFTLCNEIVLEGTAGIKKK